MIILVLITLAYCQGFKPNNDESYNIRNVATSLYLSNILIKPTEWDDFDRHLYITNSKDETSEWGFILQNITYNENRVYVIYNIFDNRCITPKYHVHYANHVYLSDCNNIGTFQYWIIEELGENRKRLKNYVEQMYLTSYNLDDLQIRENSIKAYQQWYIELI